MGKRQSENTRKVISGIDRDLSDRDEFLFGVIVEAIQRYNLLLVINLFKTMRFKNK